MANSKISALTSATTPLAGTETLPIVQSGTTKQVSVANLTAGRAVDTASVSVLSGYPVYLNGASGNTQILHYASVVIDMQVNGTKSFRLYPAGSGTSELRGDWTTTTSSGGNGNFTVLGNLIQGTAAKGINFTANSAAAGMSSQLLNWYEEGTWTAAFVPVSGSITMDNSYKTGYYTRVGRLVTVGLHARFTAVSTPSGNLTVTGLPFTSNSNTQCRNAFSIAPVAISTTAKPMMAYVSNNTTSITIAGFDAASGGYVAAGGYITATSEIYITGTYYI